MTTITVTQEDIERGQRCSNCSCPIALAMNRSTERQVYVDCYRFCFWEGEEWRNERPLPQPAIDFIAAFDAGQPVEPFSFEVEV